jgi:hypothetical protein
MQNAHQTKQHGLTSGTMGRDIPTAEEGSPQPYTRELGSYFLCNDLHMNWAWSFLVSFREHNPTMPLTLIPYDHRTDKLMNWQKAFSFDVLQSDLFPELDAFAHKLFGKRSGLMRKFAAFWGCYNHFFYLDTDIIILSDLMKLGQEIRNSGSDLAYFDADIEWVYRPGPLREEMVRKYQTKAFNTGNWFSRRAPFSFEEWKIFCDQAQLVKEGMVESAGEQPFLNYCCDRARVKSAQFSDLMKGYYFSTWYQFIRPQKIQGGWIQATGEQAGRQLCMIHFAGHPGPGPGMDNYDLYLTNRMKLRGFFATTIWNAWAHVRAYVRASKIYPIYLKYKQSLRRPRRPGAS